MSDSAELAPIREAVRALCADFPGEYWRALDRERAYPETFVAALTKAGFLAALIPEEYGGSGLTMSAAVAIMEEIQASGCNGAACHAQMYTMGTVLRHGSAEQKARYLPASPAASCACRPSASPSRAPAPTRSACAPRRCATAIITSSTARKSGRLVRSIRISCSYWRERRRVPHPPLPRMRGREGWGHRAPRVFRSSSSTCARRRATA